MNAKATPSPEITQIDLLARQYADAQTDLDTRTSELKRVIEAATRAAWPDLRKATTRAAERYDALLAAVADAEGSFGKPKTRLFHGVRVGYRKEHDSIQVLNPANTCELIKKHLPEQVEVLIATDERPVMDALDQLTDDVLKRIGCKRVPGTDAPFAKLADTDLDKVVQALLKAAIAKVEAEA
jgi:hypothetical protein